MYNLMVLLNKKTASFSLSIAESSDINTWFDATTEILDILEGKNNLSKFLVDSGELVTETSMLEVLSIISSVCQGEWGLKDIEQFLGNYRVTFPVISNEKGVLYECDSLQSIVLCLIRVLFSNGYKIQKCQHCGRAFFTRNGRTRYCNRYSTFSGYEKYRCKAAVKQINDSFEKRRKTVYERLRLRANEYGVLSKHHSIFLEFQNKCSEYKALIKKNASIANLTEYSDYLLNGEGLPKKYERIKEVMP